MNNPLANWRGSCVENRRHSESQHIESDSSGTNQNDVDRHVRRLAKKTDPATPGSGVIVSTVQRAKPSARRELIRRVPVSHRGLGRSTCCRSAHKLTRPLSCKTILLVSPMS